MKNNKTNEEVKKHWWEQFKEDFHYMEGDEFMPDGPRWDDMEDYLQDLVDRAMRSRTGSIIEGLEFTYKFGSRSLKKCN